MYKDIDIQNDDGVNTQDVMHLHIQPFFPSDWRIKESSKRRMFMGLDVGKKREPLSEFTDSRVSRGISWIFANSFWYGLSSQLSFAKATSVYIDEQENEKEKPYDFFFF